MIEVSEYVRTEQGYIARLESIYHDMYSFDNSVQCSYGEEMPIIFEKDLDLITKHSFNIIDLIEVGDYVNGKLVTTVEDNLVGVRDASRYICTWYANEHIKTIVTKEQFKAMEYKVGGDNECR